jgi:hypothetical protein
MRSKSSTDSESSSTRIGKATLQFGNQVGGLGEVEGAAGDEQDVVGLDHAVLGADRGALHQRQEVPLHALARDLGAVRLGARGDLVDLVEEDDAVLLDVLQRLGLDLLVVDQAHGLFVGQRLHGIADLHLALPLLAAADVLEHALDLLGEVFHAGRGEDFHAGLRCGDLDLDFLVVEFAFAQLLAELLPRTAGPGPVFRRVAGADSCLAAKVRRARDPRRHPWRGRARRAWPFPGHP